MECLHPPIKQTLDMATLSLQSRIDQIDGFLVESVKDVCSTMLGWTATACAPDPEHDPASFGLREINGCIGFGGQMTGSIFLCCSIPLATSMAQAIMGAETPTIQDMSDVVAELTNMLAGGCKSRLCDHDCPVVMSIPNIIRGHAIRATSRAIEFTLKQEFSLSINGKEKLQVIILGKFE